MVDRGTDLNKRVWSLFQKAGFSTKPNTEEEEEEVVVLPGGKSRKIDLSASEDSLRVKIIGQNTTAKKIKSFTALVHDLEELLKRSKANAGLLVFTQIEISKANKDYARGKRISVWTEEELHYYEVVVDAIGKYAKYEIIHSFGVRTTEERNIHTVLALKFNQPFVDSSANLFLFAIAPEKLLKTCVIYRRAQGSADAYQRMLRKKRLASVKKFVSATNALLPTNVIVHLGNNVRWVKVETPEKDVHGDVITLAREEDCELGILSIPMAYASLELIDGQHRLYGFVEAEDPIRNKFNLVVLGMKGLPVGRRRDMFVAINDKSRRMDANLVSYLKYSDNEKECSADNELMAIKVVVELNKADPFKNRIRLLDLGKQKITLKGFCGYDLKGLLGARGLLRRYYQNESKEFVGVLRMYFNILKSLFKKQWKKPEKYIIFTNRGISAFLKLLRSILATHGKPLDERTVRKYLSPLRDRLLDSYWETKKLRSSFVGSKGWKDFHRELVRTIREVHPDLEE